MRTVKTTSKWITPSSSPKSIDDLNFTGRDSEGRMNWWTVQLPKTDYWHAHEALGRAYAFELLDLIHNRESEDLPHHMLTYVTKGIASQWAQGGKGGLMEGFLDVISEFVVTGEVNR